MVMDRRYIITFPDSLEVWDSSVQSMEYSVVTVTGYVYGDGRAEALSLLQRYNVCERCSQVWNGFGYSGKVTGSYTDETKAALF